MLDPIVPLVSRQASLVWSDVRLVVSLGGICGGD